jgi:hypothetical protein
MYCLVITGLLIIEIRTKAAMKTAPTERVLRLINISLNSKLLVQTSLSIEHR